MQVSYLLGGMCQCRCRDQAARNQTKRGLGEQSWLVATSAEEPARKSDSSRSDSARIALVHDEILGRHGVDSCGDSRADCSHDWDRLTSRGKSFPSTKGVLGCHAGSGPKFCRASFGSLRGAWRARLVGLSRLAEVSLIQLDQLTWPPLVVALGVSTRSSRR